MDSYMKAIERFVKDSIEGGYKPKYSTPEHIDHWYGMEERKSVCIPQLMLSVAAWRAVGKTRGWASADGVGGKYADPTEPCPYWKWNMHRLIDALSEGKTIEEYLTAIEN